MPSDPVLREAAYYEEYARQYGDAAALRVAVDDVTKLRAALSASARPAAPVAPSRGGEPVAWGVLGGRLRHGGGGSWLAVCDSQEEAEACANPLLRDEVVALVPRESPSEESRSDDNEPRQGREEPAP